MGVRVVYEGSFPRGPLQSSILVANHASVLDIFALSAVQPPHTRWIVKRELRSLPIVGWAIRLAGFVFVDRQGRRESVLESFGPTERLLARPDRTLHLLFFPEGTRTRDGAVRPFKIGAFRIAVERGLACYPVALSGSFAILPRGWFARLRAGTLRIRFLEPIEPAAGSGRPSAEALRDTVRERIVTEVERMTASSAEESGVSADEEASERWAGRW